VSGESVLLVGNAMAGVVEAIESVRELTGEPPVVVGGLAVLSRLSGPHRATVDLDVVDRLLPGSETKLEVLRRADGTKPEEPAGVLVVTTFGEIRVDVLEVNQAELDQLSDDPGDRLHVQSHAWASDSATDLSISVITAGGETLVSVSTPVAEPGPLIAMKLQSIMNRGNAKAGTDLWDIVRLTLDPKCGELALEQLAGRRPQMAADINQHVDHWFVRKRDETLDRLHVVAGGAIVEDDVDLVAELLRSACDQQRS
jgi:hypothetical protein